MWALRVSHSAVVAAWRARERVLRTQGHRVSLVSARAWHEGGRLVHLEPAAGEEAVAARTLGSHPALFVYDPRPLWRALGQPVDVIDIHEEPFALATAEVLLLRALRRQRAPYVVYTAQNLDKRYPPPFRWIERWALRHASGVYACNTTAARIAERKGFPGRASTIDLGTDLDLFTPTGEAGAGEAVAEERVVVGFAGRLDPAKGLSVLLDAVALDPALALRVAGDGPERADLQRRVDRLGLGDRVEWLGALAVEELPGFYRSLDVLAVPSLTTASWVEQFGRVALEAMACGTPVVVSDSGALPEVVRDAAVVVPEGTPAPLAEALAMAGGRPATAARLRDAGLARARASSWEAVAGDHERLLARAVGPAPGPGPAAGGEPRPLDVAVVAYGQPELLGQALESLRGLPDARVLVVDNSSSPHVRAVVEAAGIEYVDPGRNGGFAAGVNVALGRLRPDADLLLVNPDAVVAPDDVAALRTALAADAGLASVGPVQVDADGATSRVTWPYPSPWGTWLEAFGLGRVRRDSYVIGSVLLLRREAIEHVGPFDSDRFFLYAEETDWAKRASLLGWRHAAVPEARAMHVGAATSTDPARREGHFHAAQEIYLRKHHGALGWQVARAGQVAGSALRAVVLRGDRGRAARARLRLYLRGPARVEVRPADSRPATDPASPAEAPWPA